MRITDIAALAGADTARTPFAAFVRKIPVIERPRVPIAEVIDPVTDSSDNNTASVVLSPRTSPE